MHKFHKFDRLVLVACLILAAGTHADAYIDPGTASVIYTVGLAPILAFLAWLGRRVIRLFLRGKGKETAEQAAGEEKTDA